VQSDLGRDAMDGAHDIRIGDPYRPADKRWNRRLLH
jgi:hypothetical protein